MFLASLPVLLCARIDIILSVVNLSFAQLNYHCYSSFHFPIVCMMLHKTYYCYYNFQFCLIWPIFQSTLEAMTGPPMVLLYSWLHPVTQKITQGNTYVQVHVLGGQPRHCILHSASHSLSAVAEFLVINDSA